MSGRDSCCVMCRLSVGRGDGHSPLGVSFFFNDTATTEIYTLSLHDALPICSRKLPTVCWSPTPTSPSRSRTRSEEHTSELQSHSDLVCRLLLEKKKEPVATPSPASQPQRMLNTEVLDNGFVAHTDREQDDVF